VLVGRSLVELDELGGVPQGGAGRADDFATVLALVAAGQGVALIPQLGAIGGPADVVLTPLRARRRTRIAYLASFVGFGARPF
jgi:DNA-binding transcriptional LysR family regulator